MPKTKWMILRVFERPGAADELVKTCGSFEEAVAFCLSTNPLAMGWMHFVGVLVVCPHCGHSQMLFAEQIGIMSGCQQCRKRFAASHTSKETLEVLDVVAGHRPEYRLGHFLADKATYWATSLRTSLDSTEHEIDWLRPGARVIAFHFASLLLIIVNRRLAVTVGEAKRDEIVKRLNGLTRDIMVEYSFACESTPSSERPPQRVQQLDQAFAETYELHVNSYARLPPTTSSGANMFDEFRIIVTDALIGTRDWEIELLAGNVSCSVEEVFEAVDRLTPGHEPDALETELAALGHAGKDELHERQGGCLGMLILIPALIADYLFCVL